MDLTITRTWNGDEVTHPPVTIHLACCDDGLRVSILAPFFNDPENPGGAVGKPFDKLWDYEVVEIYFLNSANNEYLEVEFCPHGQHQILAHKGACNPCKSSIELDSFTAETTGGVWGGIATVPWGYFPESVDKINAYAIHGTDPNRQYEALYPADKSHDQPYFHRLEYFQPVELNMPKTGTRSSAIWGN